MDTPEDCGLPANLERRHARVQLAAACGGRRRRRLRYHLILWPVVNAQTTAGGARDCGPDGGRLARTRLRPLLVEDPLLLAAARGAAVHLERLLVTPERQAVAVHHGGDRAVVVECPRTVGGAVVAVARRGHWLAAIARANACSFAPRAASDLPASVLPVAALNACPTIVPTLASQHPGLTLALCVAWSHTQWALAATATPTVMRRWRGGGGRPEPCRAASRRVARRAALRRGSRSLRGRRAAELGASAHLAALQRVPAAAAAARCALGDHVLCHVVGSTGGQLQRPARGRQRGRVGAVGTHSDGHTRPRAVAREEGRAVLEPTARALGFDPEKGGRQGLHTVCPAADVHHDGRPRCGGRSNAAVRRRARCTQQYM